VRSGHTLAMFDCAHAAQRAHAPAPHTVCRGDFRLFERLFFRSGIREAAPRGLEIHCRTSLIGWC